MSDGTTPKDILPPPLEQLTPKKLAQGQVVYYDSQNKPKFGYESGELNVPLPSGRTVNIFVDSRVSGQAQYSPETKAFVVPTTTADQIINPQKYPSEGWSSVDQKTDYLLRHEYNHMVWDNLDPAAKQQVIELFDHPDLRAHTRAFGAFLISKIDYQHQAETNPNVDCYEYTFGGQTKRYSKELIVNELLAHGTIGNMMSRQEITQVQRDTTDRENFGLRSKSAVDLIDYVTKASPPAADLLKTTGLVNNQDFTKDKPVIKSTVTHLRTKP